MGSLLLPIDPLLLISMNPLLLARTRHHLRVRGFWRAAQRALPRVRQVLEGVSMDDSGYAFEVSKKALKALLINNIRIGHLAH